MWKVVLYHTLRKVLCCTIIFWRLPVKYYYLQFSIAIHWNIEFYIHFMETSYNMIYCTQKKNSKWYCHCKSNFNVTYLNFTNLIFLIDKWTGTKKITCSTRVKMTIIQYLFTLNLHTSFVKLYFLHWFHNILCIIERLLILPYVKC